MSAGDDLITRALQGEGPLFEAMLDQRAAELASVAETTQAQRGWLPVLIMVGAAGRWALPLAAVARVEDLPARPVRVPDLPPALMGLVLLAGRRYVLADLDALIAEAAPRASDRPGHAVLLRQVPLALVVDRAESIDELAAADAGLDRGRLADGTVLLDVAQLAAKAKLEGIG